MGGALSSTIGGRYALSGEIASGGMATVHLARQIGAAGFARTVAVKRLHERFARDRDFVAMFLDEARLVARIRHPNVVSTIDVVVGAPGASGEPGELFLVMEYVHGESLLRLIQAEAKRGHGVPPRIAAAILAGALHGLHEAHDARGETGDPLGIVHRDVSPQNLLVGTDGIARVLDFGVAKSSERITTSHEGELKGKLSYMAPEQVLGGTIDRRTDVYAASVVLWETLTGRKLFGAASEGAVVQRVLTADVAPPSAAGAATLPSLDAVVLRGLSRDPEARFASAREMALAIENAVALATPSEVGAWVIAMCPESIGARAQIIAAMEARTSATNLRQAALSLRVLAPRPDDARMPSNPTAFRPETFSPPPPPAGPPHGSAPPPSMAVWTVPPSGAMTEPAKDSARDSFPAGVPRSAGVPRWLVALATTLAVAGVVAVAAAILVELRGRGTSGDAKTLATPPARAPAASAPACPDGMVLVDGGHYFMGSDEDLPAEKPAHNVSLHGFCIDRTEVTTDDYRTCSDRGDCKRAGLSNKWSGVTARDTKTYDPLCNAQAADRGKHPINCVDWSMADRFCKANGKRLPTEAEWEFAARGPDGRRYPWGDAKPSAKHLNACGKECASWLRKNGAREEGLLFTDDDGFAATAPVGSFPLGASRWGAVDLVGNVWEWVGDRYGAYAADDQSDPKGPETGEDRVIRGGAWNGAYTEWVRPTSRFKSAPDARSHGIGFRCAKNP